MDNLIFFKNENWTDQKSQNGKCGPTWRLRCFDPFNPFTFSHWNKISNKGNLFVFEVFDPFIYYFFF